jgi:hypothetical protein
MRSQILILVLFILGIASSSIAQNPSNKHKPQAWQSIDSLLNIGLVQSAEVKIDQLFLNAKGNQKHSDYIKALYYKLKLDKNQQNPNDFIAELNHEISISKLPQLQILHSFVGDFYKQYYNNNRWNIDQKTHVPGENSLDIKQWSKQDFLEKTQEHFLASLQNMDSLYLVSIRNFNSVLMLDSSEHKYYPSLYDLLANRAIKYFTQNLSSRSALKNKSSEINFLLPTQEFLEQEIKIDDAGNDRLQTLKIYQTLSQLHHKNLDSVALVRTELNRLQFVEKHFTLGSQSKESYLRILNELAESHIHLDVSAEVYYEMASVNANEGLKYDPFTKKDFRWEKKKAVKLAQKAIYLHPKSLGGKACAQLIKQIQNPTIELRLKEVNLPNEPILSSLTYKNIDQIHFRLIRVSFFEDEKKNQRLNEKEELGNYLSLDPSMEWSKKLPDEGDFQTHNLQLRIPEVQLGYYLLLSSPDPDFNPKSLIQMNKFWVSNLSFIQRNDISGSMDVFILNRRMGTPMGQVKLQIQTSDYNYKLRKYDWNFLKTQYSGLSGYLRLNDLQKNRSYRFILSWNQDTLVENRVAHRGKLMEASNSGTYRTQFFTDRSIYRPGQTVYFKGIVYQKKDDQFKVAPSNKSEITFLDVNQQKIASVFKTTNEYGSFNGSFIIPNEVLNGRMLIKTNTGSATISVEEYKRPNFEISVDPLKGQFRLNENIEIRGEVITFSGSKLANVSGKYIVSRSHSPIYWTRNWRPSEEEQISSGELQTDEFGKFELSFNAIADEQIAKEDHPKFNYKIHIEVSDLNGETQWVEKNIQIAHTDLKLKPVVPDALDQDGSGFIPVSATNLNEVKQAVNVSVSVFKLETPDRIFKTRKWQRPDYFTTDKETFYTYFPNDQFDYENGIESWEIDHQVFQAEINTGEVEGISLEDFKYWPSGKYKITFKAKDFYDEEVIVDRYFTIYSSANTLMPYSKIEFYVLDQDQIKIGDTLKFIIGSSKENVRVLYEIQHKNKAVKSKWIRLGNEKKQIETPLNKKLKGEITLNLLFLIDNEIYSHEANIKILDPSRKLEIKLETFRSIMKPGSKEEWKIKIKGYDKVDAELLCTMIDASLDKLKPHQWNFFLNDYTQNLISWKTYYGFGTDDGNRFNHKYLPWRFSSQLSKPLQFLDNQPFIIRGRAMFKSGAVAEMSASVLMENEELEDQVVLDYEKANDNPIQIRKNFNETAFFYPDLQTDGDGNISIHFTSPESLSRWKFMALTHTKDLRITQLSKEVITQKELMLSPNLPRFFREGDTLYFNTKIISLSDQEITGSVSLAFFDAQNMKSMDVILMDESSKSFSVLANSSVSKQWKMIVPSGVKILSYRLIASSKNHSDGEERMVPVLPKKILVTESLSMHLNPQEKKKIVFDRLLHSDQDSTLKHHRLKLEMTSNPAWLAIQALPYIEQTNRENAIELFNTFYANSMAAYLLNSMPEIKQVIEQWKAVDAKVLHSQLEKNQDLKSVELGETPWQDEADNESEQKRKLTLFFDENNISHKLGQTFSKLIELQLPDGSWTWFKGMQGSPYITQYLVKGLIGLKSKNALKGSLKKQVSEAINKAVSFLNKEFLEDYSKLKKRENVNLELDHLSNLQIQHLFILSQDENLNSDAEEFEITKAYYLSQEQKYWPKRSNYLQAMIALTLYRNGDQETANLILKSLKERSQMDDELGMYWNTIGGYYWYQAPIETQALLVEAFNEIGGDIKIVNQLKKWLIKQKQTQIWSNPKATVEAVNAIMLGDTKLSSNAKIVEVKLGNRAVMADVVEAGTSYYQRSWEANEIDPNMAKVEVINENKMMAWGALYWQYFSDLDQVSSSENVLQIEKKLFIKAREENGAVLKAIDDTSKLKVGDKVVSRMIIKVDRHLEFVHLNDMRASAFEPIEVLSAYRYEGGIGFYKSNTDMATHYYFEQLRAGTYVFENEMFVTQAGDFSNGISTIQCLYAPEFTSHSKGLRVQVEN